MNAGILFVTGIVAVTILSLIIQYAMYRRYTRPQVHGDAPRESRPAKWACDGCPARFTSRFEAEEHAMNEHNAPSREAAGHILTPLDDLPDEVEA